MAYPGELRRQIVFKVLKQGEAVSHVAKRHKIARKTIYKWLFLYKKAKGAAKKTALTSKYPKGANHPKSVRHKAKALLVRLATSNPTWGSRILSQKISEKGILLGNHGVWRLLLELDLATKEKRQEFTADYAGPARLSATNRQDALDQVSQGIPISVVAQRFHISRKTLYSWIAWGRVEDRYASGFVHPRSLGREFEQKVLDLVFQNPALSSHKIAPVLGISNHGVYNVLKRNNLTLYEQRLAFAESRRQAARVPTFAWLLDRIRSVWQTFVPTLAPAPPPAISKLLGVFFASLATTSILTLSFLWWINLVSAQPLSTALGLLFATVALTVGSFFFAYSMKYYFTLAIVLSFSQQAGEGRGERVEGLGYRGNGKRNGFLGWILGLANGNGPSTSSGFKGPVGLEPSLEHVRLARKPFVSIHLPFYNEKNVAERILTAVASFDYPNYEVVVVDDSTDETTEIVKQFVGKQPKIKLIHRGNRSGFKGGALSEALKHTDPRAEFVVVFDADFVPYPDTLELFLKYFQVTAGTLDPKRYTLNPLACVQGYQWHVLNKSENWITRGVRSEYAGSYVIERSGGEILGALKQIAGSVYMVRRDLLEKFGWGTSITEDFELTLKLYEAGYKVVYTPYIQAPAECVSTIKRLIRQRMRWAEGHSHNVRLMFARLLRSPKMSFMEKLEFFYLSPYYLQAFFFVVGTLSWLISETVFPARLPFWTSLWGWSLVLTNLLSLPLMNAVGLFLEESEEKDYIGLISFIVLSYILVPFQAYAAVKGFLAREEGPWFRTPKTGRITDIFTRGRFYRLIAGILPGRVQPAAQLEGLGFRVEGSFLNPYLALSSANSRFDSFSIRPRRIRWFSKATLAVLLVIVMLLNYLSFFAPSVVQAAAPDPTIEQQINIIDQTIPAGGYRGIVRIDTSKYTGATYYFEVVALVTSGSGTAVLTYDAGTGNTPSGGSTLTISNITATSYTRYPSSSFSPTGDQNAYVSSLTGTGISVKAARIIIVQTNPTAINDTQTQIELGDAQSFLNQSYTALTNPKYFLLDKNKYDGTINAYFEASLQAVAGGAPARASFMSGFETGDFIEWTSQTGVSAVTTPVRSGNYSAQLDSGTDVLYTDNAGGSSYGMRFGLRLSDSTPTSNTILTTIYCDSFATWRIYVLTDGKVRVQQVETGTNYDSTNAVFSDATWHLMEFKGSAAQGTSGSFGLRSDGVEVLTQISLDGCAGTSTFISRVQFEMTGALITVNIDDFYYLDISNAYPGDGKIVKLQPNAAGDESTNWNWQQDAFPSCLTVSATYLVVRETPHENFTACDGVFPATYIENTNSTGGTVLFNLQDASVGGIGTNDTINTVWYQMWAKRGAGSGTVHAIRKKWAGTASSSPDCALATSGTLCSLRESGTLSVTNVNSAQLGADKQSGGRAMYVETLWLMVDYTPMPTVKAKLQQCDEISLCDQETDWAEVGASSSQVTSTSTSWSRVRSVDIWTDLTDDRRLRVVVDVDGAIVSQKIANAKLIIDQNAAGGLTKLETVQQYNNTLVTTTSSSYVSQDYDNEFNKANFFAGTFTAYFESTIKTTGTQPSEAYQARLDVALEAVTGSSLSFKRERNVTDLWSSLPASATNIDVQILQQNGVDTTSASTSWLIIDVTNLQIPENLIFFLPFALLLPAFIRWFKGTRLLAIKP